VSATSSINCCADRILVREGIGIPKVRSPPDASPVSTISCMPSRSRRAAEFYSSAGFTVARATPFLGHPQSHCQLRMLHRILTVAEPEKGSSHERVVSFGVSIATSWHA